MNKLVWHLAAIALVLGVLLCLSAPSAAAAPPPSAPPPPAPTPAPLPAPGNPVYHVVQWGDTLTRIARYYATTVWAIAQANGIVDVNRIRAGQVLLIPVAGQGPLPQPRTYIVQPGDTLTGIAFRLGTTMWAIAQANGLRNPNLIYAGQKLYIP